jgi:hypothetical protein
VNLNDSAGEPERHAFFLQGVHFGLTQNGRKGQGCEENG